MTQLSTVAWFLITLAVTLLGTFTSHAILIHENFKDTDPKWIVIDEVAGYFFTLALISLFVPLNTNYLILAFVFFRIFDTTKPWPISWADNALAKSQSTAAFGIMFDDILAGLLAAIFTLLTCMMRVG